MDTATPAPADRTDPLTLVRALDADALRRRLRALDGERRALLVLLRAALAAGGSGDQADALPLGPCPGDATGRP